MGRERGPGQKERQKKMAAKHQAATEGASETEKEQASVEKKEPTPEDEKTTKEKLEEHLTEVLGINNSERIRDVLKEEGCKPSRKDLGKVVELLIQNSHKIIGEISDILIAKYKEREISIDEYLDAGAFNDLVNDSVDIIEGKVGEFAKKYYLEVRQEKKPEMIREEAVLPAKLGIDKSRETPEQKELKEKIKMAIREAVDYTLDRIDAEIAGIEEKSGALINAGIDEKKLVKEREKIKNHILNNLLEGFAVSILRYLGSDYQNQHAAQAMITEARRMVGTEFGKSEALKKVMPKEKIPRGRMPPEIAYQEIDFSKYTGLLAERLIGRAENTKGREREGIEELLKTWDFVKRNLGKQEQKLMEEVLEEAMMIVYRRHYEIEKSQSSFNLDQFNHEFLEEVVEPVLRKEGIKKRDKLDLFRMYFAQAFVVEDIKRE